MTTDAIHSPTHEIAHVVSVTQHDRERGKKQNSKRTKKKKQRDPDKDIEVLLHEQADDETVSPDDPEGEDDTVVNHLDVLM